MGSTTPNRLRLYRARKALALLRKFTLEIRGLRSSRAMASAWPRVAVLKNTGDHSMLMYFPLSQFAYYFLCVSFLGHLLSIKRRSGYTLMVY